MSAHFEVWQAEDNEWRWHLKDSNGEIVAEESGFDTEEDARRACDAVKRAATDARILDTRTG